MSAGDFNAKNTAIGCNESNTAGRNLLNTVHEGGYAIYAPDEPTWTPSQPHHHPDILDIVLSINTPISDLHIQNDLPSDHLPLIFHI